MDHGSQAPGTLFAEDLSPEAGAVLKVLRKSGREVIYGIYGNLR